MNKEQLLLINCCIQRPQIALKYWKEWKAQYNFDEQNNYNKERLFPALYSTIAAVEKNEEIINKLQESYIRTLFQNELQIKKFENIIKCFNQNKIPNIVLKGAAILLTNPESAGKRMMRDLDLLIPPEHINKASSLLTNEMQYHFDRSAFHAITFKKENDISIDLHHRLFEFMPEGNEQFWERAIEIQLPSTSMRMLDFTDQLFHICVHAVYLQGTSLYWVNDVVTIERLAKGRINWQQFISSVEEARVRNYILEPLKILSENNFIDIPSNVLSKLSPKYYSVQEKIEVFERSLALQHPIRVIISRLTLYWRVKKNPKYSKPVIGFFIFLKEWFFINSWWFFGLQLFYKCFKIPLRWVFKKVLRKPLPKY